MSDTLLTGNCYSWFSGSKAGLHQPSASVIIFKSSIGSIAVYFLIRFAGYDLIHFKKGFAVCILMFSENPYMELSLNNLF